MPSISLLLLTPILFAATDFAATDTDKGDGLLGRWRSTKVSNRGVSSVFEFGKDNAVDSLSAVIVEERYRLAGTDTIILQPKEGREEKQELEWDSQNRGRIEDEAAGKSIELSRAGKQVDPGNPLLGEWDATREWNGKSYQAKGLFFADGRDIWIVDLRIEHGRYSIKDQNIRFEIPNRPVVEGGFELSGGHHSSQSQGRRISFRASGLRLSGAPAFQINKAATEV